jgi:phthalate 4,5-cis-dihydrodiol dehydrogenase
MTEHRLRLGVAGIGRAYSLMQPSLLADERVQLVAAADPNPAARARFIAECGGAAYATVAMLCDDPAVDAIYVATPHQHHAEHVKLATARGKHVLVEKPMALTLADCAAMIEDARRAGVHLVVGHSHSFDRPIQRAREIIASGAVGSVRMITALNYTDFLYRPRRGDELDTQAGGGVFFNQAPHQVDLVRFLAGGGARSVRAGAGVWDRARPTEGAYSAFLDFDDGIFASMIYSGYAHFDTDEWCDGIGESGAAKDFTQYGAARRLLAGLADAQAELEAKSARSAEVAATNKPRVHEHFGVVVVSCAGADLRPMPTGVWVYGDDTRRFEALPPPSVARGAVIDELCAAVLDDREPLHNGAWGLATMEVCLAMLQSAREGREMMLQHQRGSPSPDV